MALSAVAHVHAAAKLPEKRNGQLFRVLQDGVPLKTIEKIVERNINATTFDGGTFCHCAAARGRVDVIEMLYKKGCNVNARDSYGDTPLHKACYSAKVETVETLLKCNAHIQVKNEWGDTPLDIARYQKNQAIVIFLEDWESVPAIKQPEED
jgi:ankyrin repeat protein